MHTLNKHTRDSLYRKTGLTYEQMQQMSAEEIDVFIEQRIGKRLIPAFSMKRLVNRGSVYLFFKRLISADTVDKRLAKI